MKTKFIYTKQGIISDVMKYMSGFYNVAYFCHECKKSYTIRDMHKYTSKCLSCFVFTKEFKCNGREITCDKCNRKCYGQNCFKNHLRYISKEEKSDSVCKWVKKCLSCERVITGKYVNYHKCGY